MKAAVLTVSDGVAAGTRADESGELLAALLAADGYEVERRTVADDFEEIAALVLARARGDPVGDGQDGGLHCFVFSTSLTSAITIDLSIAFAMS